MLQNYLDRIEVAIGKRVNLCRICSGHEWVKLDPNNPFDWRIRPSKDGGIYEPYCIKTFDEDVVAQFGLVEFPGCCAFCISTGAYTFEGFRRRGINKILNEMRQYIAKVSGYTSIICTDVDTNIPERKTLAANGWRDIYQIKNKRTTHIISISIKEL